LRLWGVEVRPERSALVVFVVVLVVVLVVVALVLLRICVLQIAVAPAAIVYRGWVGLGRTAPQGTRTGGRELRPSCDRILPQLRRMVWVVGWWVTRGSP
jgi:hypothetical protein